MRNTFVSLAALTVGALSLPALAEDEAPFAPFSGLFETYVVFDPLTPNVTTAHGIELDFKGQVSDDLTLGADFWAGISTDLGAGTITLEAPEVILRAESVVAGTFELLDPGTALSEACVMPTPESSNFTTEDLLTVGTCTGYTGGQSFLYTSPGIEGFTFYLSGMADPKNAILVGEVDTSIAAVLGYEGEIGDSTLTASFGIDKALTLKGGGGPLPTTFQSGATLGWDGWTVGAAAQYELASIAGGNSWAVGIGGSKEVVENLTLAAELAANGYEVTGTPMNEFGFGALAEYEIVADVLWVDAGVNVVRTIGGGTDAITYSAAVGLGFNQAF